MDKVWYTYLLLLILLLTFNFKCHGMTICDTIPNSPPDEPLTLNGPTQSCMGNTSLYYIDMPTNCVTSWYINGIPQNSDSGTLVVVWQEPGLKIINLEFICDTIIYPGGTIFTEVFESSSAGQISGNADVCIYSTEVYTVSDSLENEYQWKVNGVVQQSDSLSMTYIWEDTGTYLIEVSVVDSCGLGPSSFLSVNVYNEVIVNLGNDTTIYNGQSILLDAGNPGSFYLWSTGDTTQIIEVSEPGNYSVEVNNACSSDTDSIQITLITGNDINSEPIKVKIVLRGDNLYFNTKRETIKCIRIWNLQRQLVLSSNSNTRSIYFPYTGHFIVHLITSANKKYSEKFVKLR